MTVEERLSDWLERTTPEPPRPVSVADVEVRLVPTRRHWLPVIAAACVALIALGTVLIATRPTVHHAPPAVSTSPTPSTSPTAHPPRGPWNMTVIGGSYTATTHPILFGDGTNLYGWNAGPTPGRDSVERLDPATGQIAARLQFLGEQIAATPVLAGRYLVVPVAARKQVRLVLLDPERLRVEARLPAVRLTAGQPAHIAPEGSSVYLAAGRAMTVFDVGTRRIAHRYQLAAHVDAMAVQGGSLYAATIVGAGGSQLRTYTANTGAMLDPAVMVDGAVTAIVPTHGGLWTAIAFGHSAEVDFNKRFVQPGGGGVEPTVGVSAGVAWLGGTGFVQCADPNTGAVRARARLRANPLEFVSNLVQASGHLFASAALGGELSYHLVELHPPATCR
jgi:hypothetical protein